jgi:hypothetical protein
MNAASNWLQVRTSGTRVAQPPLAFVESCLADIDPDLRVKLQSFPFPSLVGSFGYCESYVFPPIQRVACLVERNGEVRQALFYKERSVTRFLRSMEIIGPVDPCGELVQRLAADRRPDLLTLSMQTASSFPQYAAGCRLFEVRTAADDHRITLPAKPEEYLLQLGKQSRKHLPYYVRRLQREWAGDYAFNVAQGNDITWESFTAVLELNRLRMRNSRRLSLWSRAIAKHRWPLIHSNGIIVSLRRGDGIVGATLSLLHRKEAYLIVIAHDPQYDQLNLGNICLWKTVEHLIGVGHTAFHLLWGTSFYKKQFGGQRELLRNVSYAANSRAAALGRCLRLVARCNPVPIWERAQRRLAGYIGSMRSPQHDDTQ